MQRRASYLSPACFWKAISGPVAALDFLIDHCELVLVSGHLQHRAEVHVFLPGALGPLESSREGLAIVRQGAVLEGVLKDLLEGGEFVQGTPPIAAPGRTVSELRESLIRLFQLVQPVGDGRFL